MDFIRREYKRSIEILCENGIIYWSLKEKKVKIFNAKNHKWKFIRTKESVNDMYLREIRHVLDCIKNKRQSKIINLDNGINTLKLSNLIIRSGRNWRRISF